MPTLRQIALVPAQNCVDARRRERRGPSDDLGGPVRATIAPPKHALGDGRRSGAARGADALSVAEDYRRARTLQRVLQAVCGVQMACTFVLAMLGPVGLLFAVAGDGFGMAASLVRVQRHHALCQVFNVAYLLSSVIVPLAFFGGLVGAGSPEGLARQLPKHHPTAVGVIVMGVVTTCASIVGALAAGYVLAHPLMLHRYKSVAADEESADRRSLEVRRAIDASIDDDEDELQPIDNWVAVGEPGVPLVFMPVVKPAPKPVAPRAAAGRRGSCADAGGAAQCRGARASNTVGERRRRRRRRSDDRFAARCRQRQRRRPAAACARALVVGRRHWDVRAVERRV